jgi:hypothetical protein
MTFTVFCSTVNVRSISVIERHLVSPVVVFFVVETETCSRPSQAVSQFSHTDSLKSSQKEYYGH